jgi:hypothetical protein
VCTWIGEQHHCCALHDSALVAHIVPETINQ